MSDRPYLESTHGIQRCEFGCVWNVSITVQWPSTVCNNISRYMCWGLGRGFSVRLTLTHSHTGTPAALTQSGATDRHSTNRCAVEPFVINKFANTVVANIVVLQFVLRSMTTQQEEIPGRLRYSGYRSRSTARASQRNTLSFLTSLAYCPHSLFDITLNLTPQIILNQTLYYLHSMVLKFKDRFLLVLIISLGTRITVVICLIRTNSIHNQFKSISLY